MKYQKIMLISKNEISSWESCKHITNNLAQSYFRGLEKAAISVLKVPEDLSLFTAFEHAKQIKENKYDLLIWLDHKPNAAIMLEALQVAFHGMDVERKPKFLIHLFGDFVLDCLGWKAAENALINYPVHFIAASKRQKDIVDSFFKSEKSLCSVMPFAVDEQLFNVDKLVDNRQKYRKELKAQEDFVLLYTGRISYQKNVDTLVKIIESLKSFSDRGIQLWIAGSWDDIFLPYAGINGVVGSYYTQFNSGFQEKIGSNIKFLGKLSADELVKVYHGADLFVSLSTFNDEDFGMSVAEALATGLPCLLSDWGGFANFKDYSKSVELVKVEIGENGGQLNREDARKKIMKALLVGEMNLERRIRNSQEALKSLSIGSRVGEIESFLNSLSFDTIDSLTPLFNHVCECFSSNQTAPFESESAQFNNVYREIYKNYVS